MAGMGLPWILVEANDSPDAMEAKNKPDCQKSEQPGYSPLGKSISITLYIGAKGRCDELKNPDCVVFITCEEKTEFPDSGDNKSCSDHAEYSDPIQYAMERPISGISHFDAGALSKCG